MRRLPAPVLPPPPPPKPPNDPPNPNDSPKLGDAKLPTGVERFTRFNKFWKLMETFRLYFFSLGAAAPTPCGPGPTAAALCAPPPAPTGPPGPAAGRLSLPAGPEGAAAALPLLTNAKARLTRRLTTKEPGAWP